LLGLEPPEDALGDGDPDEGQHWTLQGEDEEEERELDDDIDEADDDDEDDVEDNSFCDDYVEFFAGADDEDFYDSDMSV
jgi:hypothetical protein